MTNNSIKSRIVTIIIFTGLSVGVIGLISTMDILAEISDSVSIKDKYISQPFGYAGVVNTPLTSSHTVSDISVKDRYSLSKSAIMDDSFDFSISDKQELDAKLMKLTKQYDDIYVEFGFVYEQPELTAQEQKILEEKLYNVDLKYWEFFEIYAEAQSLADTQNVKPDFDGMQKEFELQVSMYNQEVKLVLESFGLVSETPVLSDADQGKMDEKLAKLDARYNQIMQEHGLPPLSPNAAVTGVPITNSGETFTD